jgi:ankyrin repeat protein
LQDLGKQNWEYAHRLFQCVAATSRPLRVEELAEFLAFDLDTESTPIFRADWRSGDPAYAVRSTCSSLLAVVDVDGSPVIQFAHFSVKEYLTSKRLAEAKHTITHFYVSMTPAHTVVAQACLAVLLHLDEDVTKDDLKNYPLAEYAAKDWVTHAQFEDVSPKIENEMKRLFDPSKHHLAVCVWIYDPTSYQLGFDRSEHPSQLSATPLHYAALWGLRDVVEFLIVEHTQDVNSQDSHENDTPLCMASKKGHLEAVRVLLEYSANTEIQDKYGMNPLCWASFGGHTEVARMLLEYCVDVDAKNTLDNTALFLASYTGRLAVVRLLLEHGGDVNSRNQEDQSPLHWATDEGIALVLLQYGADSNARDNDDWTPLHRASTLNRVEVAKVLLEHGVDVNPLNSINQTPLHLASEEGHLDLVLLLLQRGSDIHAQDIEGQTPFQKASKYGRYDVMRLLLEHGAQDHRTQ